MKDIQEIVKLNKTLIEPLNSLIGLKLNKVRLTEDFRYFEFEFCDGKVLYFCVDLYNKLLYPAGVLGKFEKNK